MAESNSGSGSGSGSGEATYEQDQSIVTSQVVYLSFVAVVGTVANLIVIFRGLRYKSGHASSTGSHRSAALDTTNLLVISLAISNLGTSTFSTGIFIFPSYVPNTPINDFTCRFIWPLRELFTAVACYSFTFIAVGRYLILFRSFRNTRVFSSPVGNNIALWLFCYLLFALPFAAAYRPVSLDGAWICDTYWESAEAQRAYVTFLIVFNSFVPAFLVCVSYLGIIRRLKSSRNIVAPISTLKALPDNREILSIAVHSHRAARISLLLLVSFMLTFVPYGILTLCVEYNDWSSTTIPQLELIHAVAFCLLHSGAVMDPLIIMLSSSTYRPDFGIFKRHFCR
jgi:hypothetical protein